MHPGKTGKVREGLPPAGVWRPKKVPHPFPCWNNYSANIRRLRSLNVEIEEYNSNVAMCKVADERLQKAMSEDYRCWYPLQIRFRDLDPLAHVNNSVYFIYFEDARSHYFDQLAPWLKQWPSGQEHQEPDEEASARLNDDQSPNPRIRTGPRGHHYGMLVKEATCTYELPLVRSDHVEVGVCVARVGRSSFVMKLQIRDVADPSRIYATGQSVMVWSNYYTGRPHPLPASLRYAFEQMEGHSLGAPEKKG